MIEVNDLSKQYKISQSAATLRGFFKALTRPEHTIVTAADKLNFKVEKGVICGIVGLNGAGKSTLIKMLTGVMNQSSGTCLVNGHRPFADRLKYVQNIGVVFGQRSQMIWDLPVRNSLNILQHIYQVPKDRFEHNLSYYCALFGVDEFIDRPVRVLSLGQRMRAELVSALLHDPKVLFLDEPTIGLDVLVKKQIRQAILKMNREKGTTVILTSHDLDDIDSLCQQLIVLDKGKILFDGQKTEFVEQFRSHKNLHLQLDDQSSYPSELLTKYQARSVDKNRYVLSVNENLHSSTDLIRQLVTALPVIDLSIEEQNLEDVLQSIY